MSHNSIKINNNAPNSSGNITLGVNDFLGSTPSNGQTLVYDGSSWAAGTPTATTSSYIFIGNGESNAYTNSGLTGSSTQAAGDDWYFYDTSPRNNISGATLNKTSNWITSITLPAGRYVIQSMTNAKFTASGRLTVKWVQNTSSPTDISSHGTIGTGLNYQTINAPNCMGQFEVTSTHVSNSENTISCEIVTATNLDTNTNQGNTPAEYGHIFIREVSV